MRLLGKPPIAVLENHKEASCPVMIDGETNGCGAPLFAKTVRPNSMAEARQMQFTVLRDA